MPIYRLGKYIDFSYRFYPDYFAPYGVYFGGHNPDYGPYKMPFGPHEFKHYEKVAREDPVYVEKLLDDPVFAEYNPNLRSLLLRAWAGAMSPVDIPERWDGQVDYDFCPDQVPLYYPPRVDE